MKPIVSVIMPVFNCGRFIADAIESVIQQGMQEWELIVTDDGSTDDTAGIVKMYSVNDPRIKYYYQENKGQGNARNNAICKARGDYLAMLDADDSWTANKLALQLDCIKKYDADLVFADIILRDEHGFIQKDSYGVGDASISGKEGIKKLLLNNKIATSTVLAKKKSVIEAGGFDEQMAGHYGEDYALWLRMLQGGAIFRGMKDRLANYRLHAAQSTMQKSNMMHVLTMLENLDFEDRDLKACKIKALSARISAFLKLNPGIASAQFDQVINMYPHKIKRFFVKSIYLVAGKKAAVRAVSFLSK